MKRRTVYSVLGVALLCSVITIAWGEPKKEGVPEERERMVKENEVPAPALAALKKLAAGAALTEFSEEVEHGDTFYEGSWKTATAKFDALVTAAGDLVEIEERVGADDVPRAVRNAVEKVAGKDAQMYFEKKTYIMYEVKFKKDGKRHEILYSPTGKSHEHEEESGDGESEHD